MVHILRLLVIVFSAFMRRRRRAWRPGMPVECLVVGYGGANNTGAEARTTEAIRQMLDADPRIRITLTSLDRRRTLRYIDEGDRLRVVQINPVFIVSVARLVVGADIVVLVEGSCFKENFSPALLWFFLYAAELAQRLGIPTVTYGVDAGALSPANRRWARLVADRIDLLMVRTEAAAHTLCQMGVTSPIVVTTDTAFSLVPEDKAWVETVLSGQGIDLSKPIVGIAFEEFFWWPVKIDLWKAILGIEKDRYKSIYYHSWNADARRRSAAMKHSISAYADWAASELGAQVVFFAMESLDIGPCRDAIALMNSRAIMIDSDHASARQIAALLARLDWLVTCRYHALVLSMLGAVPVIGLGHDERIASIMDELGLLQDFFIPHEEERMFEILKQKSSALRARADSIRKRIQATMPTYMSRMNKNKEMFRELIARRFPADIDTKEPAV